MKKLLVTAYIAAALTLPIASHAEQFKYKSSSGNVSLLIEQDGSNAYVKKLTIKGKNCSISKEATPQEGKLNQSISVNFATFAWRSGLSAINGVIANSASHSYAPTSVSWSTLKSGECIIPAGKALLPVVSE